MRLLLITLLAAISYAQTDSICCYTNFGDYYYTCTGGCNGYVTTLDQCQEDMKFWSGLVLECNECDGVACPLAECTEDDSCAGCTHYLGDDMIENGDPPCEWNIFLEVCAYDWNECSYVEADPEAVKVTQSPTPLPSKQPTTTLSPTLFPTISPTECVEKVVYSESYCATSADLNCDGTACNEVARQWNTPSLQECMSLCRNNKVCNYISYTETSMDCLMYDACPSSRTYGDGSQGTITKSVCTTNEPTTLLPSSTPTECPTPEVGDFGGDLITYNTSTVLPNGRIHLDFIYSSAVITDFDITMDKPGFDYSSEDANGWTEDLEMCWSSINREFTYNQMSKAMDFEVYATQVLFAVDTSYEYSKHKSVTIGGQVHEWTETHTRSKHIPFEFTLPEKSVITTAFSGKNSPFIINTRAPTTSMPTFMPTTSIPTVMPSNEPTSSEPTNAPIASQPTIGPITSTPTTIPSASPITEPTQAPVTSRPTSTPFEPTVTPTTSGPTAKPSSSPTATNPSMAPSTSEPTLTPTLSPSFSPTFEPTMMPSYSPTDFPSLEPSANPLPTSDVITTIVPYISTETAQKGQNPLMEVQFTTIVNMPWKLIEPQANGSAITNLLSFQPTQQDTCNNFADLEQEFLKQSILYCQRWVLRFEGDRHCNNQPRALQIDFISEADNGQRSPTTLSWDLDLGSSPAFECAHDLGTFQVSVQVEGHNDANGDFTSPSKAYLDEFYYFRFTGSSGAPVTSLSVTNLDVQNAETSEFICQACQLKQELKWSLKDMDVDNYITALELDSSVFAGLRFVTFDFTIEVEMSADTGRRRLAETGEKLHQKVTLSLDSSTRQGGPRTDPPTVYTSSTSKAPTPFATTKSPVATADDGTVEQNVDIMETEVDASESASESAQIPVWIFIAIGAVASAIIAAVAYRFITQSNDKDIQFKDAVTPSGVGSSYNPALKIDVKA